jgi:hypothetical protein
VNQDASKNPYQAIMFIADAFEKKERKREQSQLYADCLACNYQHNNNIY